MNTNNLNESGKPYIRPRWMQVLLHALLVVAIAMWTMVAIDAGKKYLGGGSGSGAAGEQNILK